MHIVTQNLFWLCTTFLVGGNVIRNLFWSHTSLINHFFGYAYHQAQLFLVTHNNSCTNLFDHTHGYTPHSCLCTLLHTTFYGYRHNVIHNFLVTYITTHNFFYYAYISLHTSFCLLCTTSCTTLSLAAHTITHNFYWLCTLSHTYFLSCITSCITLCWLPTSAEFTL